eukprot:5121089-Alexandrium_andersonii.AAC.1
MTWGGPTSTKCTGTPGPAARASPTLVCGPPCATTKRPVISWPKPAAMMARPRLRRGRTGDRDER